MKQFTFFFFFFFFLLLFGCYTTYSQITVDGNTADWNTVPVLSEPGVAPFAKAVSDGTNVFFLLTLDSEHTFNPSAWFTVDLYIDADFNTVTGQKQWVYNASGIDYLVQGADFSKYTGAAGTSDWSWEKIAGNVRAYSADALSAELSLSVADFAGVALGETWGVALPFYYSDYVSGDPNFFPANHWDFAARKVLVMKPRTEVSLSSVAEFLPANAYYHSFMKDDNITQYLDFQSAAWNTQNPLHWASWALNLVTPGVYNLKMTTQSTGSGKAQLTLVDMATNTVVKSFDEVWYPENHTMTENTYSTIDLSDVSAGKYMLKLTNPTTWDTFLKVGKITLTSIGTETKDVVESNQSVNIAIKANALHVSTETPADILIYSLTGQLMEANYDVSLFQKKLKPGFYLLDVRSGKKIVSKKLFIK